MVAGVLGDVVGADALLELGRDALCAHEHVDGVEALAEAGVVGVGLGDDAGDGADDSCDGKEGEEGDCELEALLKL